MPEKSCYNCRWLSVCIDPCDGCIKLLHEDDVCHYEQGDRNCRQSAHITCDDWELLLKGRDKKLEEIKKTLS